MQIKPYKLHINNNYSLNDSQHHSYYFNKIEANIRCSKKKIYIYQFWNDVVVPKYFCSRCPLPSYWGAALQSLDRQGLRQSGRQCWCGSASSPATQAGSQCWLLQQRCSQGPAAGSQCRLHHHYKAEGPASGAVSGRFRLEGLALATTKEHWCRSWEKSVTVIINILVKVYLYNELKCMGLHPFPLAHTTNPAYFCWAELLRAGRLRCAG